MEADTAPSTGNRAASTEEVLKGLNDLLQLDHDAVGAYEVAIEKLEDRDHADQIRGFQRDHERHIRELDDLIATLGGTPKNEPHATGALKQALQSAGGLGGDKGVLMAFRANELQVRTKYDSYASKAVFWPNDAKRLIDRNALDEERHYAWVAGVLQRMGVGSGEGAETSVASKLREQAGGIAGSVAGKAGDALESARTKIAGGLETAAHKLDDAATRQTADATGAKAKAGDVAHQVAGGLESTANYLRDADSQAMQRDLEQRVRQSPAQTLLILFGAGFVLGRILR